MSFMWIPSRVGIPENDYADRLSRSACDKQSEDVDLLLVRIPHTFRTFYKEGLAELTNLSKVWKL